MLIQCIKLINRYFIYSVIPQLKEDIVYVSDLINQIFGTPFIEPMDFSGNNELEGAGRLSAI